MRKRNRLESLQRLAGFTEAESARRLADRLRALDGEERRLEQIRSYFTDYSGGAGPAAAGSTIGELRSHRGFLNRLRSAVDEQRGTVETQRQQVEQQAANWRVARARKLALEQLGERQQQRERERLDRREQHRLDEIAGRRGGGNGKV